MVKGIVARIHYLAKHSRMKCASELKETIVKEANAFGKETETTLTRCREALVAPAAPQDLPGPTGERGYVFCTVRDFLRKK